MSVIKRLYNVARGKAIVSRTPGHDPALAEEPLRVRPFAEDSSDGDPSEDDVPTVEDSEGPRPEPAAPRPRRL